MEEWCTLSRIVISIVLCLDVVSVDTNCQSVQQQGIQLMVGCMSTGGGCMNAISVMRLDSLCESFPFRRASVIRRGTVVQ